MRVAISFLGVGLDRLGGVEVKIKNLLNGLVDGGFDVTTVQTKNSFKASKNFYSTLNASDIQHVTVKDAGNNLLPWNFIKLHRVDILGMLKGRGIDLFDTYDPYFNIGGRRFPVVYSANGFIDYVIDALKLFEFRFAYLPLLYALSQDKILKNADHFIIEQSSQRKLLMEKYGRCADEISQIPGGFNSDIVTEIKSTESVKGESKIILYSGRMDKRKGLKELFISFKEVSKKREGWELWLVGDGPARESMEKNVKLHGLKDRVRFLGEVQNYEVLKYVNICDIFVLPSYIECMPISLIEAMALGKPVITTTVGAIHTDLMDSSTGIMIPPKDARSLSNAMFRLIDDAGLRNSLGLNAEKRVEGFTWKNFVKKTIKAYEKAIKGFR